MRTISTEVVLEATVEFKYTSEKRAHYNDAHGQYLPGCPPEIDDIKVITYTSLISLKYALDQALKNKAINGSALVPIDLWDGLNESEKLVIERSCEDSLLVTSHCDTDQ
jgi:hypothetical protein